MRERSVATDILLIGAWFGLVTGLVEGTGLLLLQKLGWQSWEAAKLAVTVEIVWISAVFDLVVFAAIGVILAGIALVFPRRANVRPAVFLFTTLMCFNWFGLTGRLLSYAVLSLAIGVAVVFIRWLGAREAAAVRFYRASVPWVAALAVLVLAAIQGALWLQERIATARLPAASPNSPNILVVLVDTLRADHLASYGYSRSTSPNVDRLAQQGVLFENAIAASSWTPPSHASMLTGRYPYEHGVEWYRTLDTRYPTIAEALSSRGYRTAAFSANLFGFNRGWGFGRGFIRFEDQFQSTLDMVVRTEYGRVVVTPLLRWLGFEDWIGRKRAVEITQAALRWVQRDAAIPFFAFLNYFDLHDPYLPPQPYRARFGRSPNPGGALNSLGHPIPTLTPEQLQGEIDAYDGAIAYVDDSIGQLLAGLQQSGRLENTLVIFLSDHGESFGEHGMFFHQNGLYREVLHVPLIVWWPGHVPSGMRVATPVTNAALPATLMDLIGAGNQQLFPNRSLTELWKDPGASRDWSYPLAELAHQPFKPIQETPAHSGWLKSLVSPQWQYIAHEKLGPELYEWIDDPGELHNLVATSEGSVVAGDFASRLQHVLAQPQRVDREPHEAADPNVAGLPAR